MTAPRPLHDLAVCAEEQFRLHLLGLVVDMLHRERREGRLFEYLDQFPFLQSYVDRIETLFGSDLPAPKDWRAAVRHWQGETELPLDRLHKACPGPIAAASLLLIAAVEEDPRLSLLDEPEGGAPTLGGMTAFLCDMFPDHGTGDIRAVLMRMAEVGVLQVGSRDAPRIQWSLRVSPAAFELVSGAPCLRDHFRLTATGDLPSPEVWVAPGPDSARPEDLSRFLQSTRDSTILLRSDSHNGRKTFVRMAAQAVGKAVLHCQSGTMADRDLWAEANLVAALADALLLIECAPVPGERIVVPAAPLNAPHCALVTTHAASIDHGRRPGALYPIVLARPDQDARKRHWRNAGWSRHAAKLADRLLTSGHIYRVARGAVRERKDQAREAIDTALASIRDPRLETTAHRIALGDELDDLVLDPAEREEVDALALRCRLREQLHSSSEAGVKALLSGASGTGKTLAAKHLARTLSRPLYRIDLAATVNKYIGETEKNLEMALAAAEELDVVLLLDEGDALLAKRTDVGSATDRYANMETNFLLQRLEDFRGIILVTTNDGERIDKAFRRRMDAIIPFRLPDQLRRQEILMRQLGEHDLSQAMIDEVACRCNFTGGQIHNVVLHARLLALAAKSAITDAHMVKAVEREYRKTGEHCPLRPALAEVG
ncbi:ATP-binding protein [Erythrobacter litoralis]|uniref:ATPase, AAA family protein n=1 Tax=Erythrobacter litoralis (strain HTCC2594) TaxID=314225 RepID=Q2N8M5_ERYLH|nr:ATP-binding protein [Erythrobacter litoralis]ABC63966.1 ATPase, AAA family protein [Erythrobacter litoralis HTCC2594]